MVIEVTKAAGQTSGAINGQCLCGAVTISVRSGRVNLVYCHCQSCRKSGGSASIAVFPVAEDQIDIHDPQSAVRYFESSPGKLRSWCGICASPLYSQRADSAVKRLRAGLFDKLPDLRQVGHIYCTDKADWDTIGPNLEQFAQLEPGRK